MKDTQQDIIIGFDSSFLEHYAGKIISDPKIAIIELIANCWDAGACRVEITWPPKEGETFTICDDGAGMNREEFEERWKTIYYNRQKRQGTIVTTTKPPNTPRVVYGRNGKGRFSLFCFNDKYSIETWKDGTAISFNVERTSNIETPFHIHPLNSINKSESGTRIECTISKNYISEEEIIELISTKFFTDPSFEVFINCKGVTSPNLEELSKNYLSITVHDFKPIDLFLIESNDKNWKSKNKGVAWWVNNRLVGEPTWSSISSIDIDGRSQLAKKYSIVVKADCLEDYVKSDWTWFNDNPLVCEVNREVEKAIIELIGDLLQTNRTERKKEVITHVKDDLEKLGNFSKEQVGIFVDNVLVKCPSITEKHLIQVTEVLTSMEASRSKYRLLEQLSAISVYEIDALSDILESWSIIDAKMVLEELHWRLSVIQKLETLTESKETRELQELQPLFGISLWIFGPEYDSATFYSNRTLLKILQDFYSSKKIEFNLVNPKKRPDFLIIPDGTIGLHTRDAYSIDGENEGIDKIVIIELKKGGFKLSVDEKRQAEDYAVMIKDSGKITKNSKIICYILGSTVECEEGTIGEQITLKPISYTNVLRRAHNRTFNLLNKIKEVKDIIEIDDIVINDVLAQKKILAEEF